MLLFESNFAVVSDLFCSFRSSIFNKVENNLIKIYASYCRLGRLSIYLQGMTLINYNVTQNKNR